MTMKTSQRFLLADDQDTPPHVVEGRKAVRALMAAAEIKAAATEKADNPQEALDVAKFLREAADDYEANDCGKGHIALARAFGYSQQLYQKGALKLVDDSKDKTAQLVKIDQVMAALKGCHLPTVFAVTSHYDAQPYVDKFEDIDSAPTARKAKAKAKA